MTIATKELITALRTADSLSFYHGKAQFMSDDNLIRGMIRAQLTRPKTAVWNETPAEARFQIDSMIDTHYSHELGSYRNDQAAQLQGFDYVPACQFSETWQGIAHSIRVGDELSLQWIADGGANTYLRDQGIHADVLRLSVKRGKLRLGFDITRQACPDNSARMIRRSGSY